MDFDIHTERQPDVCAITLSGEVDVSTSPRVKATLVNLADEGCSRVVIDLRDVSFIDSSGLGVLVGALRRARENDGWVRIVCTREATLKVFRITGLDKVFQVFATPEEAAGV